MLDASGSLAWLNCNDCNTGADAGLVFLATGAPADAAAGEEEDDGDGRSRGEERRSAGPLQRALCLPLQAGTFAKRSRRFTRLLCKT